MQRLQQRHRGQRRGIRRLFTGESPHDNGRRERVQRSGAGEHDAQQAESFDERADQSGLPLRVLMKRL